MTDDVVERLTEELNTMGRSLPKDRALLDDAIAEIVRLRAERDKMKAALKALVERLDFIHEDAQFKSVWVVNQIHCGPYRGPQYVNELDAARAALKGTMLIRLVPNGARD